MDNLRVDGIQGANRYKIFGEKVLDESRTILLNAGVTIPVGAPSNKETNKAMTGLVVEHPEEEPDSKKDKAANEAATSNATQKNANSRSKFNDSRSSLNNTYRNLVRKNVGLNSKPGSSLTNNNLTEALDNIDNVGKEHIKSLNNDLPEDGLLSGSITHTYEASKSETTSTTNLNINNSWQNKRKNFGIDASASINYENSYSKSQEKSDEDSTYVQNENNKGKISGNFSVNARYNTKDLILGGGVSSTYYNDSDKMLDINVSGIHKPSKMGFDLMRRTITVKDTETGEVVSKSNMKLKVDIIDRKHEDEMDIPVDEKIEPHHIKLPSESSEEIQQAKDEDNKIKSVKSKYGSGFDVDFEYDDTKCGFISEYGVNLINNPKTNTRLTVSPVLGLYSYSGTENSEEAAKLTFGGCVEFSKKWADGKTIDADLVVLNDRIAAQGSKPVDAFHAIFTGYYSNPKKNFNVNLDAGYIKSGNNSIGFIEGKVDYQVKNFNIGVKGGYSYARGPYKIK